MTTVAIILRTRDRPILLARALCGILAQTHADWRLVLVDGGAPGPVAALAETYATAFGDRLAVLHVGVGPGPDGALTLGLAHPWTAADCVALHDDDDTWHPEFLRAGLALLDAEAGWIAAACHGWVVEEVVADGGATETGRREGFSDPHPLELARLLSGTSVPSICLLMRRTALDRLRATGGLSIGDDAAALATALALEGEVGVIPRRLAFTHRRTARAGPYGNRSAQVDRGDEVAAILRRNRLLRAGAAVGTAGLVPAIDVALAPALRTVLDRLDRNGGWGHGRHADTQERLIRLEDAIATLHRHSERTLRLLEMFEPMPRPLGRIWTMLERPRRWLRGMRGRG